MATEAISLIHLLNNQSLEVGDKVVLSLEFADTEGYLHPTDRVIKPEWMPEEAVLPVFQGYLERFKRSGASSFKSSSQDDGYKFAFEVKEQTASLTITKEAEYEGPKSTARGETRGRFTDDTKEEVLESLRNGMTAKDAAEKFEISVATLNLWKKAAGLTSGKRGRKPGGKAKATAEKAPRPSKMAPEESITLNGKVYVPAHSLQNNTRSKGDLIKALNKLESEIASLRALVLD